MLFSIFTAEKKICILHGHVFVMRQINCYKHVTQILITSYTQLKCTEIQYWSLKYCSIGH